MIGPISGQTFSGAISRRSAASAVKEILHYRGFFSDGADLLVDLTLQAVLEPTIFGERNEVESVTEAFRLLFHRTHELGLFFIGAT